MGLADHLNEVELEQPEMRHLPGSLLAENDVDVVRLGLPLEPGGDVGVVSQDRIVKALVGPEIADNARSGIQPDAGADLLKGLALLGGLDAPLLVEAGEFASHRQGRAAGVFAMEGVV